MPIPVSFEDYAQIQDWLAGRGPKGGQTGEVLKAFRLPMNGCVATIELIVGPAGPALDGFVTVGSRSWTAKPVYQIDEASIVRTDGTTYRPQLQGP